jgi:hypothetical protein
MGPWVDQERGAAEIGKDFIFSRKPNPVLVAMESLSPEHVREDLSKTREICVKFGNPVEFILKDISTVRYEPERLFKWANIAMDVVKG